jgi:hypothetical protein
LVHIKAEGAAVDLGNPDFDELQKLGVQGLSFMDSSLFIKGSKAAGAIFL